MGVRPPPDRCGHGDDARPALWLGGSPKAVALCSAASSSWPRVSVLTFEGMSMGFERFIHQRVMDVLAAGDIINAAEQKATDGDCAGCEAKGGGRQAPEASR